MATEGGRINFMFLGPLPTQPLDPLLLSETSSSCIHNSSKQADLSQISINNYVIRAAEVTQFLLKQKQGS